MLGSCSTSSDGGVYVDATFGAGGYTRLMLEPPTAASSASTATAMRSRGGFALVDASDGGSLLVEGRFSELDEIVTAQGFDASTASSWISACRRCSSTRPTRGFSFRLDGPLDMRMSGEGPNAADVVAKADETDLANIIFQLGEERHSRRIARAIVRGARRGADPLDAAARRHRVARRALAARRHPSGDAHVPGAAHLRQRRARRIERRARRGGARPQARRPACGGVVPFARRPHRQDVSRRAQRDARRLPPPAGSDASRAELHADQQARHSSPTRPRSPQIRARVRRSCAAAIRTEHPAHDGADRRSSLPSLADVTGGA